MKVGFTGTRERPTNRQLALLVNTLEDGKSDGSITEIHHGACVGADAAVHAIAIECELLVHVWPPVNQRYCAVETLVPHRLVTVHPRMPYLDRNREIVRATTGLVALPKQDEQPDRMEWGGTWYTVNFAERMDKPVAVYYPKGVVEQRLPDTKGT